MAVNFVTVDRETPDRFPASVHEYLPEDHLARFVVEIVDQLDLSQLVAAYAGTGSRPYHPAMLVALLFYGYATGVFSSRKLALATHNSIAFRDICANTHPPTTAPSPTFRGLRAVQGEWTLVCLGWNLKRLFALKG
ncbi:transposase-like protein DUF772 [Thiocapsa rosea]|uniref:Transposase-like protein DUF772 n=1 Tax=Thiocapsa rosea TaxID=69360 RepID=A0A495UKW1_9GAMM|nr:transposase-like protein DUF772 [Thiocapsa rosea]